MRTTTIDEYSVVTVAGNRIGISYVSPWILGIFICVFSNRDVRHIAKATVNVYNSGLLGIVESETFFG